MILCCGEALIDMIPEPAGRGGFVPRCGGAALNTAIALARQGARAGLLSGLSSDRFGRQLDSALAGAGVDRSLVVTSDRPTTLAFVHLAGEEAEFSFYDEGSATRLLTPRDLPVLPGHVRALLLGGISLCHGPAAAAFEVLGARVPGRLVMLDPNIRPGFVGDETAYRARLARMMARAHVVKLSGADLGWIDPSPVPVREKLEKVLAAGPALVLLTLGSRGAVALHRDGRCVDVAAHRVGVADAVGAGDAFNAGFLARLARLDLLDPVAIDGITDRALQDCLENAGRVAALALTRPRAP